MRLKLTHILLILVIMIFLMGATCSSGNPAEGTVEAPYYGGVEGVTAEFVEIGSTSDTGAQNEVWEDETFPIEVHLKNNGEFTVDANQVELEIKGISSNDFSGIDFEKNNPSKLEKVSEFLPEGGEDYVNFGDASYQSLSGTHYDANIFVYYNYPYKTYINIPKVCYKENVKDSTVCNVDETKQAFSSGGPIQVGTVRERYIGKGKILLEIPIKNVGNGRVKAYSNDEFQVNFDEIAFNQPADWDCTARGNTAIARIAHPSGAPSNEEVVIRCTNDKLEDGALYTREVKLELTYLYQDWIEQRVRIKDNPES